MNSIKNFKLQRVFGWIGLDWIRLDWTKWQSWRYVNVQIKPWCQTLPAFFFPFLLPQFPQRAIHPFVSVRVSNQASVLQSHWKQVERGTFCFFSAIKQCLAWQSRKWDSFALCGGETVRTAGCTQVAFSFRVSLSAPFCPSGLSAGTDFSITGLRRSTKHTRCPPVVLL